MLGSALAEMISVAGPPVGRYKFSTGPEKWSLVATQSAQWRALAADSAVVQVVYKVVGEVSDLGTGYPTYEIHERLVTDTVQYVGLPRFRDP